MSLDDFSSVTIQAEGPPLTAVGFGTIGLAAYVPSATFDGDYSRTYTSTTAAKADLLTDSAAYKMVAEAFAQSPRPDKVKVLRLETAPVCTYEIVPVAANATVYSITVEVERAAGAAESDPLIQHTVSYTSDGSGTVGEICDGVKAALDAAFDSGDLTCALTGSSPNGTKLTLTTTGTGRVFWVSGVDDRRLKVTDVTANPGVAADLDAIRGADSDWYGLCTSINSVAYATAAAGWAEAQLVVYATQTSDWAAANNSGSTTDLQPALKALGYNRTIVAAKKNSTSQYYGPGAFGERFPFDPGTGPDAGGTFNAKRVKGLAADPWSDTQKGVLKTKGYVLVESTAGVTHTLGGRAASGKPLDQTRFEDWFGTRLQEKLATVQLNNGRVPNDARGRDVIEAACRAQVQAGITSGGIAKQDANGNAPSVVVPTLAQTPAEDRAARVQNNIQIGFEYTGAIEKANVLVTVVL